MYSITLYRFILKLLLCCYCRVLELSLRLSCRNGTATRAPSHPPIPWPAIPTCPHRVPNPVPGHFPYVPEVSRVSPGRWCHHWRDWRDRTSAPDDPTLPRPRRVHRDENDTRPRPACGGTCRDGAGGSQWLRKAVVSSAIAVPKSQ